MPPNRTTKSRKSKVESRKRKVEYANGRSAKYDSEDTAFLCDATGKQDLFVRS